MKTKNILSAAIAASMFAASLTAPVFADYTEPADSYDIVRINMSFNDGTVTNPIDNTPALKTQANDMQVKIFYDTSIDTSKEFFFTFDFCFDNENGRIEIPKYKSSGVDKVGPQIKYSDTKLVTETSKGVQELGDFTIGQWYTGEIEGRTGAGVQYTTFRLYSYNDGTKTLIQETPGFDMRNLASENRSLNGIGGHDVSLDNIKLISENPDTITITADDEVNAGQQTAADYTMTRLGETVTKYAVTWSLYDENNENEITDGSVTMEGSTVVANITSPAQTVTLRAEAVFGDKTLTGAKQITINAVDTGDEIFDTISVSGSEAVKAGTNEIYSFQAFKAGADVTQQVADEDIVWSVYNCANQKPVGNKGITIENGMLTVADDVIAQTVYIRAASTSGKVFGSKNVDISFSDNQKEAVIKYDACETELANTVFAASWDGSAAYQTTDTVQFTFGDQTAYTVTDLDIKFPETESGGLTLYNNNGSENSNIRYHSGTLSQQTGGSSWTTILPAENFDADAWYHIEFLYMNGATSGYNVYKYDSDGNKTLAAEMKNVNRRNDKPYGKIGFSSGVTIDNFKVVTASPDSIEINAPGQYMFAGEESEFTYTASRKGHVMQSVPGLTWSALDAEKLPILDGLVKVNADGIVSVDAMVKPQTITIRATAADGTFGEAEITIQSSEIITVTNIGINEAGDKIVRIYANKNFYYNDDIAFIIAIYDGDGYMKSVKIIKTFGDRLNIDANEVAVDFNLPDDFNSAADTVSVMVWTAF